MMIPLRLTIEHDGGEQAGFSAAAMEKNANHC